MDDEGLYCLKLHFMLRIILKIGIFRISESIFGYDSIENNDRNNPNALNLVPEPIEISIVSLDAELLDQSNEPNQIVNVRDDEVEIVAVVASNTPENAPSNNSENTPSRRKRKRY